MSSGSIALTHAVQLLDRLNVNANELSFLKKTLKLELRFLIMFLKYTADRCSANLYQNLQPLVTSIQDVMQNTNKLHALLSPPTEKWFKATDAVLRVLKKIKLVKPGICQVLMQVSMSSTSSGCPLMSNELVFEFIDFLIGNLKELLDYIVDLSRYSLRDGIESLKGNVESLKVVLSFTAERCKDGDKLNQFFTHAQAAADRVACLAYTCLTNKMDEDMASRLGLQLSDLAQRIDPITPGVKEIYIGVLEASKSLESISNTSKMDETLVDFIGFLLELLDRYNIMPVMEDQIQTLRDELTSLRCFLKDAEKFSKLGKLNDLLAHAEVVVLYVGPLIYSLFQSEVNREVAKGMRLGLPEFLSQFRDGNVLFTKIYVNILKAQISNFPSRTDELGALDLLLRNLEELLNDRVDSISLLKDHIQVVQRDLQFLGSFLTTIAKQRHENEELAHIWRRIIHVMYEVEYVIDLVVVKDNHVSHLCLWLSNLIKDINVIKTKINEMWVTNNNMGRLHEYDVKKTCGSPELSSQMSALRIDGEMVGFKDEEEKLIKQLVLGSKQLQIISIVGMPGLGKTFLANKVYNNPIIRDNFHVCAWCNISQVHEKGQLLINILNQLKSSAEEMSQKTDEELAGELKRCLLGWKYLIVLDDIWDIEAWNELKRSFPNEKCGSRIVFTSRFSNLALLASPDSKLHQLRRFSEGESWELLQKKIFLKDSCPSELLQVGQQIAECCNGLPLTVVVVAGLLARRRKEQKQWREVADNLNLYIISDPQRQCMGILDLSYKSLPDYLRSCFLYLGVFPEDRVISTAKLLQLWVAEGFVVKDEPNSESTAESYLMDLIDRNLVIASKDRSTGGVKACIVQDLIREFCLEKAKEEHFLKVIDRNLLTCSTSPSTSYEQRRISVHITKDTKFFSKTFGSCIRSLLLFAPVGIPSLSCDEVKTIIHGLKLLRVLDLRGFIWLESFPNEIVLLVQLRYLAISGTFRIPSSIANLQKLETFIVGGVRAHMSVNTILKMAKLRHLRIYRIDFNPSSGDSSPLESLQSLSSPTLSEGGDMKYMRKFPNLKKLSCRFKESWNDSRQCNCLPVLDFLSKLETLKISCYNLTDIRHPLEFSPPSTIKKLTLSFLRLRQEHMSTVGKLPNLQVLKLLEDAFEGDEWNTQDGEFPKLKFLKLEFLDIKKWVASENFCPPIEQLFVSQCCRLEEIPSCLEDISTLKVLKIACYTDSLKTLVYQIQEEQRDFGNEELQIKIIDMTC